MGNDLAATLFGQAEILNAAAAQHIQIGRSQFARDVLSVIGTASARKPLDAVVRELIALCGEENAK